jgi:hypothetical protein
MFTAALNSGRYGSRCSRDVHRVVFQGLGVVVEFDDTPKASRARRRTTASLCFVRRPIGIGDSRNRALSFLAVGADSGGQATRTRHPAAGRPSAQCTKDGRGRDTRKAVERVRSLPFVPRPDHCGVVSDRPTGGNLQGSPQVRHPDAPRYGSLFARPPLTVPRGQRGTVRSNASSTGRCVRPGSRPAGHARAGPTAAGRRRGRRRSGGPAPRPYQSAVPRPCGTLIAYG